MQSSRRIPKTTPPSDFRSAIPVSASRLTARTRNVKPGSIVLFHNNAEYVEEYLPSILDKLKSDGYEIVPIGQLIMKENYHMDHAGKQTAD